MSVCWSARGLHYSEYLAKARALDRSWHHTAAGHAGPVETELRTYGGIRGLVFGAYAEASDDVEWLANQIAELACNRPRGAPRYTDPDDA
eukprot:4965645-Karenia_brevis.AAC.1